MSTPSPIPGFRFRSAGIFATAVLAASVVATPDAVAASTSPRVYPSTPDHWVGGVTPVTFHAAPGEDMSAVTSLTLIVDGEEVNTDTAAPWSIDWDTTRFHGDVLLSTRATTATQSRTTVGHYVTIDNTAPSMPTVGFPRMDGYIGRGGTLTVNATDDHGVNSAELVVDGDVISSNSNLTTGSLDLRWDVTVPNGKTSMTVRVRDRAGNVTELARPVIVDNDRPVISGSTSAASAVHGIFKVTLTGYRDASPLVEIQGSVSTSKHVYAYVEEASRTVTIDSRNVPDGKYTIGWHAIDAAGNVGSLTRALIVDNRNPTVSITKAPKNKATLAKTFKVTAKAGDLNGIAKVQLLINGKVVKTDTTAGYAFTVNPKKYGKKFTVQLRAYDKAGNVKYTTKRTYRR